MKNKKIFTYIVSFFGISGMAFGWLFLAVNQPTISQTSSSQDSSILAKSSVEKASSTRSIQVKLKDFNYTDVSISQANWKYSINNRNFSSYIGYLESANVNSVVKDYAKINFTNNNISLKLKEDIASWFGGVYSANVPERRADETKVMAESVNQINFNRKWGRNYFWIYKYDNSDSQIEQYGLNFVPSNFEPDASFQIDNKSIIKSESKDGQATKINISNGSYDIPIDSNYTSTSQPIVFSSRSVLPGFKLGRNTRETSTLFGLEINNSTTFNQFWNTNEYKDLPHDSMNFVVDFDENGELMAYVLDSYTSEGSVHSSILESTTYVGDLSVYPSDVIDGLNINLSEWSKFFDIKTQYTTNSIARDSTIEIVANDKEGTIEIKMIPKLVIQQEIYSETYTTDLDPLTTKKATFRDYSLLNNSDDSFSSSITIKGFAKKEFKDTEIIKDVLSILPNTNINPYSAIEFSSLAERDKLLIDEIFNNRKTIFNSLPNSFSTNNINIIKFITNSDDVTTAKVIFTINNYYQDWQSVSNPPLECTLTLEGFAKGITSANENTNLNLNVDNFNFSEKIAQFAILQNNDYLESNYSLDYTGQTIPISASELDINFLQQFFNLVVAGNKESITYNNITNIALRYDNINGKIHVEWFELNAYYDNTSNQLQQRVKKFDTPNLTLSGFKKLTDDNLFSFKNTIDIKNNSESVNDINQDILLDRLNNDPNYSIFLTNPTNPTIPYPSFDVNLFGKVIAIESFKRNELEGTISFKPKISNVYISPFQGSNDLVYVNEYPFNEEVIITGFYAVGKNTIISDAEYTWGMKASDVQDDPVKQLEFLGKFYQNNIKYPYPGSTSDDLSINVISADNSKGELVATFTFAGYQVNGVKETPPHTTGQLTIRGFDTQAATDFNYNVTIDPILDSNNDPMNIYDVSESDIKTKLIENNYAIFNQLVLNPATITPSDFEIISLERDFATKNIYFKIKLNKYWDSLGKLNDDPPLISPRSFTIGKFTVNDETLDNYTYTYYVPNISDQKLPSTYFTNPNYVENILAMKTYVVQSINEQVRLGYLSIPSITEDNFTISLNTNNYSNETIAQAYGSGKISLVINLHKYYNNKGELIENQAEPKVLYATLTGWYIYNTSILTKEITLSASESYDTSIDEDTLKQVILDHNDEIFKDAPFIDESNYDGYKDNLEVTIDSFRNDNNSVSLICTIGLKYYFSNGSYVSSPDLFGLLTIKGFSQLTATTFTDELEISAGINVLPTDLFKNQNNLQSLDSNFKSFLLSKVVLPNKIGLTVNDFKSITLSDPNNVNGTIKLTGLTINGYDYRGNRTDKSLGHEILITDLSKVRQTEIVEDHLDLTTSSSSAFAADITSITEEDLKTIIMNNAEYIFDGTLPSINSIENVEIIKIDDNYSNYFPDINAQFPTPKTPYLKVSVTLNSRYNNIGQLEENVLTTLSTPIWIYGFANPKQTQLLSFTVPSSLIKKVFDNNGIGIFLSDVIDDNWGAIQSMLINLINECYKNMELRDNFVSVIEKDAEGNIAWATKTETVNGKSFYFDGSSNWDFLTNDISLQNKAKKRLADAAEKAINNPDNNNNISWGKMEIDLRMLRGIVGSGYSAKLGNLSINQGRLLLRAEGFLVSKQSSLQQAFDLTNIWIIIGSVIAGFTLIAIICLAFYKIKQAKQNKEID